jgi:hypothetical protein
MLNPHASIKLILNKTCLRFAPAYVHRKVSADGDAGNGQVRSRKSDRQDWWPFSIWKSVDFQLSHYNHEACVDYVQSEADMLEGGTGGSSGKISRTKHLQHNE